MSALETATIILREDALTGSTMVTFTVRVADTISMAPGGYWPFQPPLPPFIRVTFAPAIAANMTDHTEARS